MSDREQAMQVLERMPEKKIRYVLFMLNGIERSDEIPNEETLEAMRELEEGHGEVFYGSARELFDSWDTEED